MHVYKRVWAFICMNVTAAAAANDGNVDKH
jgi:hypothetical protein